MLTILLAAVLIMATLFLAGLPLAAYILEGLPSENFRKGPLVIALAIIFGFAFSAFASVLSYGAFGIDTFFYIFFVLFALSWVILIATKKLRLLKALRIWEKLDFLLVIPVAIIVYSCRGQWFGINAPGIRAGLNGTDLSQNLMAALSARSIPGQNWFEQSNWLNTFLGQTNVRDSIYHFFSLPSFRDQAAVDYLIYGTRWGLTVPASQMVRIFGPESILWETGIVQVVSMLSFMITIYASSIVFSRNRLLPILVTISTTANAALLFQFLNGGLSQIFSLPGFSAILLSILLILRLDFTDKNRLKKLNIIAISAAGWIIINSTYIDIGIILIGFIGLFSIFLFIFKDPAGIRVMMVSFVGLILSFIFTPTLTYVNAMLFDLRMQAASGTGTRLKLLPLPSELLGFLDSFSNNQSSFNPLVLILGIIITTGIVAKAIQTLIVRDKSFGDNLMLVTSLVIVSIGLIISLNGKLQTNYIYTKITVYLAPIIILTLYSLYLSDNTFIKSKNKRNPRKSNQILVSILALFSILTLVISSNWLYSDGNNISVRPVYADLISDKKLVKELENYNFLIPYHQGYELFGIFGNVHWVSKATNDQKLNSRIDFPLRLMCFTSDTTCKPTTKRISNLDLERYGIIQFESPITIADFSNLSTVDR